MWVKFVESANSVRCREWDVKRKAEEWHVGLREGRDNWTMCPYYGHYSP